MESFEHSWPILSLLLPDEKHKPSGLHKWNSQLERSICVICEPNANLYYTQKNLVHRELAEFWLYLITKA